jgi:hypothetical protein
MDPTAVMSCDPCTLIMGLSLACLGAPLALASCCALAPAALVCGYVGLGLGVYGTVLCAPLLPCLLPLLVVPLAPIVGCGCHQAPFQWRY